jgi:hypothetical protein
MTWRRHRANFMTLIHLTFLQKATLLLRRNNKTEGDETIKQKEKRRNACCKALEIR